jgi:hypothetical protein
MGAKKKAKISFVWSISNFLFLLVALIVTEQNDEESESLFAWIWNTISMKEAEVFKRAGRDALWYLHFEKNVAILLGT